MARSGVGWNGRGATRLGPELNGPAIVTVAILEEGLSRVAAPQRGEHVGRCDAALGEQD